MDHYVQLGEVTLSGVDMYSSTVPAAEELVNGLYHAPKVKWAQSVGAKVEIKRQWKDMDYATHIKLFTMLTEKQFVEYVLRF
jgi:hypothetical protein